MFSNMERRDADHRRGAGARRGAERFKIGAMCRRYLKFSARA
jgi:hypothetical protein